MSAVEPRCQSEIVVPETAAALLGSAIAGNDLPAVESFASDMRYDIDGLVWTPELDALESQRLKTLLTYWQGLCVDDDIPHLDQLDPIDTRGVLGCIMLLDVVEEESDFRYRLYGTEIARRSGFDLTGKLVSDVPVSGVSAFFMASYRAVVKNRRSLYTIHTPPYCIAVSSWSRLILPLRGESGAVERLLVGNIPGKRRGSFCKMNQSCFAETGGFKEPFGYRKLTKSTDL